MIRSVEATAPGKLILLGEYAVLFGAPAAVLAIERRARVHVTASGDDLWRMTAPGLAPGEAELRVATGGHVTWNLREDAQRLGLVEQLLRGLAEMSMVDPSGLRPPSLELDTREFFEERVAGRPKLGLGSSAALIVATTTALVAWGNDGAVPDPDGTWLAELVELHRRIQGGMGSGIDVAASLLGGTLRYQLHGEERRPDASPIDPPAEIHLRFIWTGRPASTGDFLGRLHRALDDHPTTTGQCLESLGDLSEVGIAQLEAGDGEGFLETVEAFWHALDRLGRCIDVPILSPEHVELHELALGSGVRYKPSGAGGGDFGLALGEAPAALDDFVRGAEAAGYHSLPLDIARQGAAHRSVS